MLNLRNSRQLKWCVTYRASVDVLPNVVDGADVQVVKRRRHVITHQLVFEYDDLPLQAAVLLHLARPVLQLFPPHEQLCNNENKRLTNRCWKNCHFETADTVQFTQFTADA